jgi:hypothetical protein
MAFDHSILSAAPGQTVTFRGTITNLENAIVDLNSCDVNLTGPFTTDSCIDFLLFAPLFLGPLETSAPFDMFFGNRRPAVHWPVRFAVSRLLYRVWSEKSICLNSRWLVTAGVRLAIMS